jgi:threonine aldolase
MIDLRSDTVTRPTAAMREAMARAEVGDDVFGEDPTVNALQERVASLLGKEAALYVPSGSMANQIAIKVHTDPGDDVLVGEGAHSYLYESGAGAAISGVQFTILGKGGLYDAAEVEAAIKPDNHHFTPTRLICAENTHNRGGGRVWPPGQLRAVAETAHRHGLRAHLDGARLLNAVTATGVAAKDLAVPFDSASICLSKGLGAPVGSVLAGSRAFVHRAHRIRKMLGGGMRQAGVLAAAGLYALDHHVARLAEDHAHARILFDRLRTLAGVRLDPPDTNIVIFDVDPPQPPAADLVSAARERGLLFFAIAPRRIRIVTHLDVTAADCQKAADVLGEILGG